MSFLLDEYIELLKSISRVLPYRVFIFFVTIVVFRGLSQGRNSGKNTFTNGGNVPVKISEFNELICMEV